MINMEDLVDRELVASHSLILQGLPSFSLLDNVHTVRTAHRFSDRNYLNQAAQCDRLVAREDYQHNILRALNQVQSLSGADIIELGAGTGRLTLMLAPIARSIVASDAAQSMLEVAAQKLSVSSSRNWHVVAGDNRSLPLPDRSADVSIAGWSLGHTCGWYPNTWHAEIRRAIDQMRRVLRRNGKSIILETLGTGYEAPHPPSETLAAYYSMLENNYGFSAVWLRTDYQFQSVAEADELTRFFFGAELADRVQREQLTILPECTGLWWRAW